MQRQVADLRIGMLAGLNDPHGEYGEEDKKYKQGDDRVDADTSYTFEIVFKFHDSCFCAPGSAVKCLLIALPLPVAALL